MEPRKSVKLIANLTYYRKISGVVAGGKVLALPLLALFLVPFLIEAAQAFQLNRVDYRPAVTQPVKRAPLNGINGSNFSTNRFNCAQWNKRIKDFFHQSLQLRSHCYSLRQSRPNPDE